MSNNRFEFRGLEEFKQQLRALPDQLASEASHIVIGAAESAAADVRRGYSAHVHSGNLEQHVKVEHRQTGTAGVVAVVKSTARHAHLFEFGTQARHNAFGANRGSMPAGHVFVPAIVRARRAMYQQLVALLERAGLRVSGQP